MEIKELSKIARDLKEVYDNLNRIRTVKVWKASDYAQGLVGDSADLMRLINQRESLKTTFNQKRELDKKIRHELADCLWCVIALADELNVDLEKEYLITIDYLKQKLAETISEIN